MIGTGVFLKSGKGFAGFRVITDCADSAAFIFNYRNNVFAASEKIAEVFLRNVTFPPFKFYRMYADFLKYFSGGISAKEKKFAVFFADEIKIPIVRKNGSRMETKFVCKIFAFSIQQVIGKKEKPCPCRNPL